MEGGENGRLMSVGFGDDQAAGAVVGGELNGPDPFEGAQGPPRGDGLGVDVGVGDAGVGQVATDDRFDQGGQDAQGDVSGDAVFGPVVDGAEGEEVLENPEPRSTPWRAR